MSCLYFSVRERKYLKLCKKTFKIKEEYLMCKETYIEDL